MGDVKINKEDIEKYYNFLGHEKQSELRFIEPRWKNSKPIPVQEWANNLAQFIFLCEKYNGQMNLYIGLNERKPLGDKDEDIEFITNIGHDIDAHKGGEKSFLNAQETALRIKEDCIKEGYNEPMIICSGRGFWVIHHISPLKNTEDNQRRIKEFGKFIKKKYGDDEIEMDSSVYNPSRIARIPGTINVSDKDNNILSFIVNNPKNQEDFKLSEKIRNIELPKINYQSTGETPKDSCAFMDYCLSHEIPKGERHKIISRNISIYIHKHPDKDLLKEQYFKIQKGSETELDQWLKNLEDNPDKDYPFSCGELIKFQKKYKIPLKCKGCIKFEEYKKEKKAEENLANEKEREEKAEVLGKAIKFFTDKIHLAKQFIKIQPIYYDKSKLWWIWNINEKRWGVHDETDIMNYLSKNSEADTISSKERVEILEALKQVSRRNKPEPMKPTWVQFKDTIVDVYTGEEFKASPKYFVTNPIPYDLHKERYIETPVMDKIFEEWVGKEYVQTLYEIISYCLIPSYPLHRIFCLIGSGMNGKSCFLNMLRKFIGEDNCCSTELDTLISSRFEVTRLHKKLICQMGETNFAEMSKTSMLKKLSGGDYIGFEYKNKNPFEDTNYAKILIATNNLPTTTDKTIGFYRRWLIIDFFNRFSEQKDVLNDIPEEEYEMLAVKCLSVLKNLLDKREFHNEGSVDDRMKKYEDKSEFFKSFFEDNVKYDFNEFITKYDFYKKFTSWCKERGYRNLAENTVGKKMKDIGIEGIRKKPEFYDKQIYVWDGIKWK